MTARIENFKQNGLHPHREHGGFLHPARRDGAPKELLCDFPAASELLIPPREYVVPGFLQRGLLIELIGPGGSGKGQLALAWAVALALGFAFGGFKPSKPGRMLFFSAEDDLNEQNRRVAALLRFFGATPAELGDRLKLSTVSNDATLLSLEPDLMTLARTQLHQELTAEVESFEPDCVILDPLTELHDAEENNNSAMKAVGAELRSIARQHNIPVLILHHSGKGAIEPGNPDAGRGASSIPFLARKVMTLVPMAAAEALKWNVTAEAFFRLDGAKANHEARGGCEWFQRIAVQLDNGDLVARCEPWCPPEASEAVTPDAVQELVAQVRAGDRGKPWSARLGRYDRSIARAMKKVGITSREAQQTALEALLEAGVEEVGFRKANRAFALGLRFQGKPDALWE